MAAQALDQQTQSVILGMQFALLLEHGPQHLLQQRRVVRQGIGVDLHAAMMNEFAVSDPETMSTKC
ncbi:hypothetical protein ACELLULO517_27910 [Acidisoma cellulosilytica]|uniref:Uncharacterized protein n=1 Tax=Acidisoma cellulosilyticum TaxID=2802395 RepID=A0A963Z762_9PROT|nr:hypothetical protein [Acidisoma cellulosilyticum]MCB8884077.1 hypothetical protein [Acidisoma cellulosilyticum]